MLCLVEIVVAFAVLSCRDCGVTEMLKVGAERGDDVWLRHIGLVRLAGAD